MALLIHASSGPKASSVRAAAASTASASDTSSGSTSAWPPRSSTSRAVTPRRSRPRAIRPRRAPRAASSRTVARPMPAEAPVTTTTGEDPNSPTRTPPRVSAQQDPCAGANGRGRRVVVHLVRRFAPPSRLARLALCLALASPAVAGALAGTVHDPGGAPLAGAGVTAHAAESTAERQERWRSPRPQRAPLAGPGGPLTTTTDAAGRFPLALPAR